MSELITDPVVILKDKKEDESFSLKQPASIIQKPTGRTFHAIRDLFSGPREKNRQWIEYNDLAERTWRGEWKMVCNDLCW